MAARLSATVPLLAVLSGCGPGKPEISSVDVQANPNNTLSASVAVQASNISTVKVRYAPTGQLGDGAYVTPSLNASSGKLVVPVLGLTPSTSYDLQVVATTSTGATLTSATASFTSGVMPQGLPSLSAVDGGVPSLGYTLLAPTELTVSSQETWPPGLVVDGSGNVVWYYNVGGPSVDVQQQPGGTYTLATSNGFVQVDPLGNLQHTWTAHDSATDPHEIRLPAPQQALLFGYDIQTVDLTPYGGQPNTPVLATVLQRVSSTDELLFSWDPFDHLSVSSIDSSISLTATVPVGTTITTPAVDWTHGNAIEVADDGNYLVSFRNISAVVKIDSTSGQVIWQLGGNQSTFTFPDDPLGGPSMQHGIRELSNGHLIMFDDGNEHTPPQSRAVEYELDTTQNVAHLVWSYEPNPIVFCPALGFAERLEDGNTLVTFATASLVQEVSPAGEVIWQLSGNQFFYRAFRISSLY
jgi:hypothetical protein